jgi:hypothetical protein
MKNNNLKFVTTAILSVLFLFTACTPTLKVTGTWVNKEKIGAKKYKNLFIIALAEKFEVKTQLEMNIAFAAVDRGLNVVKSTDIFPYTFSKDNIPNKEVLLEKITKLGCDAILTVVPVNKTSETRYVPGSVAYTPTYYPYYGNFYNYYNYYTPIVYSPGYYETDKHYFLESNLYDFASGELLWSVQSEANNPASIESFSKEYTDMLVRELNKITSRKK